MVVEKIKDLELAQIQRKEKLELTKVRIEKQAEAQYTTALLKYRVISLIRDSK